MAEDDTTPIVTRRLLVVAGLAWLLILGVSAWAYVRLPADALVPMHWNASGEVDRYAGKFQGLFLMAGLFPAVVGLLLLVPRIEPRRANLRRSAGAYRAVMYGMMAMLVAVHAVVVAIAMGRDLAADRLIMVGGGVLLVVIGNWLPKVRSNFMFGIRTPWTLTSETAWRRTHRVGGYAFVAVGLLVLVGVAVLPSSAVIAVLAGGLCLVTIGLFVYSFVVWRSAPDRHTPNGAGGSTQPRPEQ